MKALVTGANGFIGSHLVEALLNRGCAVRCLVRKTSNLRWLKGLSVELAEGDCTDRSTLFGAVRGVERVYHVGGVINAKAEKTYYEVNCAGTVNLAEACLQENRNLRKFVFISSISAAGPTKKGEYAGEDMEPNPISDYGRSKLEAEKSLRQFMGRLPITIIRPCTILGDRENDFLKILKLVKGRVIPVFGNKDAQTSLCFIGDLVNAIILAGEKEESTGETYFVSDGKAYSWEHVIGLARQALGIGFPVIRVGYPVLFTIGFFLEAMAYVTGRKSFFGVDRVRESRDLYWIYDISRIKKGLGFKPEISLKSGMEESVRRFRQRKEL